MHIVTPSHNNHSVRMNENKETIVITNTSDVFTISHKDGSIPDKNITKEEANLLLEAMLTDIRFEEIMNVLTEKIDSLPNNDALNRMLNSYLLMAHPNTDTVKNIIEAVMDE